VRNSCAEYGSLWMQAWTRWVIIALTQIVCGAIALVAVQARGWLLRKLEAGIVRRVWSAAC